MPLSYYHNAHAQCDFEKNQASSGAIHGRDTHESIYDTKLMN